jgi:hypothetical protein
MVWGGAADPCIYSQDDEGRVCRWNVTGLLAAVRAEAAGMRFAGPKCAAKPTAQCVPQSISGHATTKGHTILQTSPTVVPLPSSLAGAVPASKQTNKPLAVAERFSNPYQFKATVQAQSFKSRLATIRQRSVNAEMQASAAAEQQRMEEALRQPKDPYAPITTSTSTKVLAGAASRAMGKVGRARNDSTHQHTVDSLTLHTSGGGGGTDSAISGGGKSHQQHAYASSPLQRDVQTPQFRERGDNVKGGNSPRHVAPLMHSSSLKSIGSILTTDTTTMELRQPLPSTFDELQMAETRVEEDDLAGASVQPSREYKSVGRVKMRTAVLRFFHRCPVLHHSHVSVFDLPIIASTLVVCDWEVRAHTEAGAALCCLNMPGVQPHVISAGQDRRVRAIHGHSSLSAGMLLMSTGSTRNRQWDVQVDVDHLREYLMAEELQAKLRAEEKAHHLSRRAAAEVVGAPSKKAPRKKHPNPVNLGVKPSSRLSERQSQSRQASRQGGALRPLSRGNRHGREVQSILHAAAYDQSNTAAATFGSPRPGLLSSLQDWPDDDRPSSAWLRQELNKVVNTSNESSISGMASMPPTTASQRVHSDSRESGEGCSIPDSGIDASLHFSRAELLSDDVASRVQSALKELHAYDDLGTSQPR